MNNIKSPKLEEIHKKINGVNESVLKEFWRELEETGSPLIENIEGDSDNKLVTFIMKEEEDVERFVLIFSLAGYELEKNVFEKLEEQIFITNPIKCQMEPVPPII